MKINRLFLKLVTFYFSTIFCSCQGIESADLFKSIPFLNSPVEKQVNFREIGDVRYSYTYISSEERIQKDEGAQNNEIENSIENEPVNMVFKISIAKNKNLKDIILEKANYLNFEGAADFKMLCGQDTFDCIGYHFENGYEMGTDLKFILVFQCSENDLNQKGGVLLFNDGVFNNGLLKFRIGKDYIKNEGHE